MAKKKPTKKKKSVKPSKAKADAASMNILLVDQVIFDSRTRKFSAVGLFQLINTTKLPAIYPRFTVFAELIGQTEEKDCLLEILSPKGAKLREFKGSIKNYLVYDIVNLPLNEAGAYQVSLKIGEKTAGIRSFSVIHIEAKEESKPN